MAPEKPHPRTTHSSPPQNDAAGATGYRFGKNSVEVLLQSAPERIFKLLIAQEQSGDRRMQQLIEKAQQAGTTIQFVPRTKLDKLSQGETPHQGIIAMVAPKPLLDLPDVIQLVRDLPEGTPALLLALDEVTDPRNFGALLRVAAAAEATAVIVPKTGSAGFSPVVAKASVGTIELVNIAVVPNLADAIERLKEVNVWWVGAALDDTAIQYDRYDYRGHTGIVLGSEDKGLRRLVRQRCDQLVQIPMARNVESLNVSVAAGILAFEARRQRRQK